MKISFRAYMEIEYIEKRLDSRVSCMLLAVDFDNKTVHLSPLDKEIYEDRTFWTAIRNIELPRRKLKIL